MLALFDADYYRDHMLSVGIDIGDDDVVEHWARHGLGTRLVPTPGFDEDYYLATNPDVAHEGLFGYHHYLIFGRLEARAGHPDAFALRKVEIGRRLLNQHELATGSFAFRPGVAAEFGPLLNLLFPMSNASRGHRSTPDLTATGSGSPEPAIKSSPFFDPLVYVEEVRRAGLDPVALQDALRHWLSYGIDTGLVPSALFDESYYFDQDPMVGTIGMSGYIHWLYFGQDEGRQPSAWLATSAPQVTDLLRHSAQPESIVTEIRFAAFHRVLPERAHTLAFATDVVARLLYFVPDFTDAHADIIVRLFNSTFYARASGLPEDSGVEDLLFHCLSDGLWEGRSCTPLFDSQFYADAYEDFAGTPAEGMPMFLHWLMIGRPLGVVPTVRFDARFYRAAYADLRDAKLDLFEHFALSGIWEDRSPNALFDAPWYLANEGSDGHREYPAYINFLLNGAQTGRSPSQLVASLIFRRIGGLTLADFDSATEIVALLNKKFNRHEIAIAMHLFVAKDLHRSGDDWDDFVVYLRSLTVDAHYSSPLFDSELYQTRAAAAGFPILKEQSTLTHFLHVGVPAKIVPTLLFENDYYLRNNPDLRDMKMWGFEHFIRHGIFEGRKAAPTANISLAPTPALAGRKIGPGALTRERFWRGVVGATAQGSDNRRVHRVLSSPVVREIMTRARLHEPEVPDLRNIPAVLVPPHHDPMAEMHRSLRARFKHDSYDTIICVPWLRTGGADLVACQLAEAIGSILPDERVLFLQIDQPTIERADWAPAGAELVNISDLTVASGADQIQRLLYAAFLGLSPKRIINVNSRACWDTYVRFGKRLSYDLKLYAYLFCWDETADGLRVGYPSLYYPRTAEFLSGAFVDTQYLKDELSRIYLLPRAVEQRIIPLLSPARTGARDTTEAEKGVDSRGSRARPRVLWAGRLDRQKRFDLVLQIAEAMPEMDFHCWGSAVLDPPPDLSEKPANLSLTASFGELGELPLGEADAWLFTSQWEGQPTILIELAMRGMPIVASAVGGVPELIRPDKGWLIEDVENVDAYVDALREAVENPAQRIERGRRLRDHAAPRHARDTYYAALRAIFIEGRVQ